MARGMKAGDVEAYAREAWTERFQDHCRSFLTQLRIPWEGRKVLDLGAGPGTYVAALLDAGVREVVWHDIDPVFERVARERIGDDARVRFHVSDLLDLPYDDEEFDTVIVVEAWYWAADEARLAREVARLLPPGGTVVIDALGYGRIARLPLPRWRRVAHLVSPVVAMAARRKLVPTLWSSQVLTEWRLRRAGFDVVLRHRPDRTRFLLVARRRQR